MNTEALQTVSWRSHRKQRKTLCFKMQTMSASGLVRGWPAEGGGEIIGLVAGPCHRGRVRARDSGFYVGSTGKKLSAKFKSTHNCRGSSGGL